MDEDNETKTIVVKQKSPIIDGKTLLIGGGVVGLILFLFFRGGGKGPGKGGYYVDKQPLVFKLRDTGLWLNDRSISVPDAIARVLAGGRKDALVIISGNARQGDVDAMDIAFQQAGIVLRSQQPQTVSSLYAKGSGRYS